MGFKIENAATKIINATAKIETAAANNRIIRQPDTRKDNYRTLLKVYRKWFAVDQ